MSEERLPIDEYLTVVAHKTISKSSKWWYEAVIVQNPKGRKLLTIYGRLNRDGQWKRKQKITIANVNGWEQLKRAVEEIISELQ